MLIHTVSVDKMYNSYLIMFEELFFIRLDKSKRKYFAAKQFRIR